MTLRGEPNKRVEASGNSPLIFRRTWLPRRLTLIVIMKNQFAPTYQTLYNIYKKYKLRYNRTFKSGQICLMWSTRRLPDVLTETEQISDIEKAFGIHLAEDEAIELYDMTLREAVTFIEKRIGRRNDNKSLHRIANKPGSR